MTITSYNRTVLKGGDPACARWIFSVAARLPANDSYHTGFERVRAKAGMMPLDLAIKMNMNGEDYVALEQGDVRPCRKTIEKFCAVMRCHPLDLQSDKSHGPLPPVMLDVLLGMAGDDSALRHDRVRAIRRLRMEYECAQWMIDRHGDSGLAILKNAESAGQALRKLGIDVEQDKNEPAKGPRESIDAALISYELGLEQNINDDYELLGHCQILLNENFNVMRRIGFVLYGSVRFNNALMRIIGMADERGFGAVRDVMDDAPDLFEPLQNGLCEGVEIDRKKMTLRDALHLWVDKVEIHATMLNAVKRQTCVAERIDKTRDLLREYQQWRRLLKTQMLLAWCGNGRIIDPVWLNRTEQSLAQPNGPACAAFSGPGRAPRL